MGVIQSKQQENGCNKKGMKRYITLYINYNKNAKFLNAQKPKKNYE